MPVFRKMTEIDVEYIARLEAETFSDAWTSQGIRDTFKQQQAFIVVAEVEEKLVGYCIVYYVLDEGEIARIAVDSRVRHQGVGRGLLDYTLACCKEKQITRLLLDVRESNAGARAFYSKYGFAHDGIRKNYYEQPKEDAVLMSMMF